ncbi:Uncharacterised protein [uncultured Clostridium sp.]|uniref:hypothetical protein n=1 Tax=uncultured Clostridium sp. TaxID=59620 RepID=UPI000820DB9B|nr:hypothetical protein [uncultured Clostridium sp.]SCI99162.1 Uncharacterised protein [uncultured Clostridium sp.]
MKGKRELIIEIIGKQFSLNDFRKFLDQQVKTQGVKYSENVKMYFNIAESKIYCVSEDDKQFEIEFRA